MNALRNLLGMLGCNRRSIQAQAERQALPLGVVCFCLGFLVFSIFRGVVYASLPDLAGQFEITDAILRLVQTVFYVLLIYIPGVIILSNAISGDDLGFAVSRDEYRAHASAMLPLWGMLFLVDAPLQYFAPQFLVLGVVGISIGMLVLLPLLLAYTIWAIKELNYLSLTRATAVFMLLLFTLPLYTLITSMPFRLSLPFLLFLLLLVRGYHRIRGYISFRAGENDLQQSLNALTLNPQDAGLHHRLGTIHLDRGDPSGARRYFENALAKDSKNPDYHYSMGRTWERTGDWSQALSQYEEAYRLDPECASRDICREVGKGYLNTGQIEKGSDFLQSFLAGRDADPEGRYWLAVAMQKAGKYDQMRLHLGLMREHLHAGSRSFRKKNREWIYKARNLFRSTGLCADESGR